MKHSRKQRGSAKAASVIADRETTGRIAVRRRNQPKGELALENLASDRAFIGSHWLSNPNGTPRRYGREVCEKKQPHITREDKFPYHN